MLTAFSPQKTPLPRNTAEEFGQLTRALINSDGVRREVGYAKRLRSFAEAAASPKTPKAAMKPGSETLAACWLTVASFSMSYQPCFL